MSNILDLTKKFELNLQKADILSIPKMDTKLAVDKSGSMDDEFRCGWVDKTIDLFIAASMKFDDDGVLEIGFFNHGYIDTPDATAADAGNYTRKHGLSADGGTSYAPPIKALANKPDIVSKAKGFLGKLFGGKEEAPAAVKPAYIGMVTDGDAMDFDDFVATVHAMDKRNFLQIIAIGNQVTLHKFASVTRLPNVALLHIPDPHKLTDDGFYELLCNEKLRSWVGSL